MMVPPFGSGRSSYLLQGRCQAGNPSHGHGSCRQSLQKRAKEDVMAAKTDNITTALGQLEKVLEEAPAGQERAWASRVEGALAKLEQALPRQAPFLRPPPARAPTLDR